MISILFGAGASYGSEKNGIRTPPLGNNLFRELDNLGGSYNKLSNELKDKFLQYGFETGMLEIPNDSRIINPLQNELASYLSEFTPTINSAYVNLFKTILDISRVSFITLNYDLLIEISLALCGLGVTYDNGLNPHLSKQYDFRPSLLKLHGSSNFIPEIAYQTMKITAVNCGAIFDSSDYNILRPLEVKPWCNKNNPNLSPVMCMYNKNKRMIICPSYFNEAKKKYIQLINKTNLIVIIGTKFIPHDKHVWDVILSGKRRIVLVDPYPEKNFANMILRKNKKNEIIKKSFFDSVNEISKTINFEIKKGTA